MNATELILSDKTIQRRFWSKVVKDEVSGCLLWTASPRHDGYGQIGVGGRNGRYVVAHRASWVLSGRQLPEPPLQLDHLCRVRRCVNPEHLEAVTCRENLRRGARAQVTHCPHGHPYSGENLRIISGARKCRACRNASVRLCRSRHLDRFRADARARYKKAKENPDA